MPSQKLHIRAIAPSRSMSILSNGIEDAARAELERLGFRLSFGKRVKKTGFLDSASAADRLLDIHDAYADSEVDLVLSVVGGSRAIDLLPDLDWDLLAAHPKPLCGYSDITVLLNAIFASTGAIGFSGPHFSSFAMDDAEGYQSKSFTEALMGRRRVHRPSASWSDDDWYITGEPRQRQENSGWSSFGSGSASGTLLGGNLSCFMALLGTPYAPPLTDSIILVEDTSAVPLWQVRRYLVALSQHTDFRHVNGLIFGRFQRGSGITKGSLGPFVASLPASIRRLPIVADVDAGHTQPIDTFAIGSVCTIDVSEGQSSITTTR